MSYAVNRSNDSVPFLMALPGSGDLETPSPEFTGGGLHGSDIDMSWNSVMRLSMLSLVATGGTMGSVFIISAITVIEPLQVRGNIYLVSLALGNLLVTGLVLPTSCVAILASIPHDQGICSLQWHATVVCFLVSVLSFMFMAVENFLGIGNLVTYDLCCTKFRLVTAVLAIWTVAVTFAAGQYALGWGPSFCKANLRILFPYHVAAGSVLICLPALITILYFTRSIFKLKSFKVQVESLEDPTAYVLTDEFLLKSNIVVFVVLLLMWTPGAVVATISLVRPVAQNLVDTSWWLALSNSCVYSYVYAATNRDFREAFNKLFYYCCCKSHVTFQRRQRESRRTTEGGIGLRVHIIPGLNIYAQRKETTASMGPGKGICDL